MKLKALRRIGGVKIIAHGKSNSAVKRTAKEAKVAFAGDIYEGPEDHITKGLAEAVDEPTAAAPDSSKGTGATLDELKNEAAALGATEDQLKALKSKKAAHALIDELSEGGESGDLGLGD